MEIATARLYLADQLEGHGESAALIARVRLVGWADNKPVFTPDELALISEELLFGIDECFEDELSAYAKNSYIAWARELGLPWAETKPPVPLPRDLWGLPVVTG